MPVGARDQAHRHDRLEDARELEAELNDILRPEYGVEGEKIDNMAVGLTLGYQINDNLSLTVGYKSTINDNAPGDLSMDGFMISLVSGWHSIIEGAKRLASE